MKRWWRWALIGVAILILSTLANFIAQSRLVYPAPSPRGEVALDAGSERVWLPSPEGGTEAFLLKSARFDPARPGTVILYAHGNGELIDFWVDQFDAIREAGASVLLVEYPGYGRSRGSPSQESITQAMMAAHDWASARPGIDPARVVGYGRSLGGGALCALSLHRPLAALVLESSFTSVRDVASEQLWVPAFLIRDPFDNLAALRSFRGPVLLMHGDRDRTIPPSHSRRLHEASPGSELKMMPCGHNDCPRPWPILTEFLSRHDLL